MELYLVCDARPGIFKRTVWRVLSFDKANHSAVLQYPDGRTHESNNFHIDMMKRIYRLTTETPPEFQHAVKP